MKGIAALAILPSMAFASSPTTVFVEDIFRDIVSRVPTQIEVCEDVNTGDLGGALIGGAIGSAVGNQVSGSGGAGTAGAVIGAIIGSNQGGKTERRCRVETRYLDGQVQKVYSHSRIIFTYEGKTYTLQFRK